jgi:uncharacterized protein (TIGR02246 family)
MLKNALMLAAACFLMSPLVVLGQSVAGADQKAGTEADQKAIRAVMERFAEAWNHHDAHAFAALFAEDADFTNVRGAAASGRAKIEEFHAPMFATMFKNSILKYAEIKIRFVCPEVAAVDVRWTMTGATDPQGNPWPDRQGLLNFVMTKDVGDWQITVMHNMDLPGPPPATK